MQNQSRKRNRYPVGNRDVGGGNWNASAVILAIRPCAYRKVAAFVI